MREKPIDMEKVKAATIVLEKDKAAAQQFAKNNPSPHGEVIAKAMEQVASQRFIMASLDEPETPDNPIADSHCLKYEELCIILDGGPAAIQAFYAQGLGFNKRDSFLRTRTKSMPSDGRYNQNSGLVVFDSGWSVAHEVAKRNDPSLITAFGAATGAWHDDLLDARMLDYNFDTHYKELLLDLPLGPSKLRGYITKEGQRAHFERMSLGTPSHIIALWGSAASIAAFANSGGKWSPKRPILGTGDWGGDEGYSIPEIIEKRQDAAITDAYLQHGGQPLSHMPIAPPKPPAP